MAFQTCVLDRWSDRSVRWLLLRWRADVDGAEIHRLRRGQAVVRSPLADELEVEMRPDGVRIVTGAAAYRVERGGLFPFASVEKDKIPLVNAEGCGLEVIDHRGQKFRTRVTRLVLEEHGPLYVRIRVDCILVNERASHPIRVFARLAFFAGSSVVRFDVTLHNPQPAKHSGGFWELGDPGSCLFRNASLKFVLSGGGHSALTCSPESGMDSAPFQVPFELYQASSGGENWNSKTHVNRLGVVPLQFRGYRLRAADREQSGLRAEPVLWLGDGAGGLGIAMRHFWANFPKAIETDGLELTLHLFPPQSEDLHELQGGEQKTHTFFVAFDRPDATDQSLEWCRSPTRVRADPDWYCASGVIPHLIPQSDKSDLYEVLVHSAIEGSDCLREKRERIDEFGWRNFGEIYADHEAALQEGVKPLVSHYNNQYDSLAGFVYQFFRTGDFRWWELMQELAAHVADIDIYRTHGDKSAYNYGSFWHTYHYIDAGRSTHRSYPRAPGVGGGGPSNEHNYTTGLMLHYFLTGEPLSRDTVLDLAHWVMNMDDGAKTVFRLLAHGPTGLASQTAEPGFHGPGRGAGNSVNAMLDAFLLSRDRSYLNKAQELIRRCIHPRDDAAALELGKPEMRWSYVVFLQKLARYLNVKLELNELDLMYAYGRAALLHYARWMAAHEYLYLDKPEVLEYPTETWAANEIRKSDVFYYAALHCSSEERARFIERAEFFFDHGLSQLGGFETRTRARPLAILLTSGIMHDYFRRVPEASAPPPRDDISSPVSLTPSHFQPQKQIAIRRAFILVVCSAAALLLAGLYTYL
jgi:hypothetical protein